MIEQPPAPPEATASSVMTVTEFTGLLGLITSMLAAMEARIIGRLDENSRLAAERWTRHDDDSKRVLALIDARFERIEGLVNGHLDAERVEDLELRARIKPVKSAAGFIGRNWRGIVIVIMSALGILGLAEGKL